MNQAAFFATVGVNPVLVSLTARASAILVSLASCATAVLAASAIFSAVTSSGAVLGTTSFLASAMAY